MTFGSFLILSTRNQISPKRVDVHKVAFSLPKEFNIGKFIRSVVIYTLLVEFVGACLLFLFFRNQAGINPLWNSIFHSISAFCTAGFSLYNSSFVAFSNNLFLNIVIFVLSFLGAIGYIVMVDVWLVLKNKKERITFTSKIILYTTIILLTIGTGFLFLESVMLDNTNLDTTLLKSFFQTMTALTTVGFNTVPIGEIASSSLFIITLLMIIGASPSGTGGGIKSTTLSALFGVLRSVFSSDKEYITYNYKAERKTQQTQKPQNKILSFFKTKAKQPTNNEEIIQYSDDLNSIFGEIFKIKLMGRTIPFNRVIHAIASFVFYFFILFIGVLFLLSIENFSFEQIFFESASALGTVGLSTGITSSLSHYGKIIIILLMFIGRIGPISFGIILFSRKKCKEEEYEDIVI
jgi:trk system potassium uptake protein TrkH